ncbi:MAG: helix-turn-helix transcriptional regulator [Lachnospiraceae bacterium]|nr:helix-turn-helix transcriptional regulator [Lachnospiraceae bacterium]
MSGINLSQNITRLRHEKKITQEQLADFVGVTKASVSKWETGQSMPDILILPQLAAFFNVSIDDLMGYEPSLTKEQIDMIYTSLSSDFVTLGFEEAMEKSRQMVKQYYSCYEFLFNMAVLWLNHHMLADSTEEQQKILQDLYDLCEHIMYNCNDMEMRGNSLSIKALVALQLGKALETVDMLEEQLNPLNLINQSEATLVQAYQVLGQNDKAKKHTQICIYNHLIHLVGNSTNDLALNFDNFERCEEIIRRIEKIVEAYNLSQLNQDVTGVFWYQAAIMYSMHENKQRAIEMLGRYVSEMERIFKSDIKFKLKKDDYFTTVDTWFNDTDLRGGLPRDIKVIWESAMSVFSNPVFSAYAEDEEFCNLKARLGSLKL